MAALAAILPFFGKTLTNCIYLVGDNCAVSKHLARVMGGPLMGSASHRLNIAVRMLLDPHEAELTVKDVDSSSQVAAEYVSQT
ncbi:hypothetical protein PHMEG_00018591 [Phytophthora megakarya]|uniref:Uncharacterized protein n=1 Tax=Phytophthora megakarya TaxID=4795 RepID=A0A225VVI1_9STRA|nr:hypothetical protein PHMEG_00018591 [Phytophthora megakarya]